MKWLALALVVLVLALAGFPATVGAVGTLIGYRADSAQAISPLAISST